MTGENWRPTRKFSSEQTITNITVIHGAMARIKHPLFLFSPNGSGDSNSLDSVKSFAFAEEDFHFQFHFQSDKINNLTFVQSENERLQVETVSLVLVRTNDTPACTANR